METGKEELWQEIRNKIERLTKKIKMKIGRTIGKKKWFSVEWREKKRRLGSELRKWRKEKLTREEYVKRRREYRT